MHTTYEWGNMSCAKTPWSKKNWQEKFAKLTLTLVGLSSPNGGCQPPNIVIDVM
jgi:hypothetical protein